MWLVGWIQYTRMSSNAFASKRIIISMLFAIIFNIANAQNLDFFLPIIGLGKTSIYTIDTVHDGGYIAGGLGYFANGGNYLILKTDSNGNELWRHHANFFNGSDSSNLIRSIHETRNHDFIFCGELTTVNPNVTTSILMARTDSLGNLIWLKTIAQGDLARGFNILELENGDILITGTYRDSSVGVFVGKYNYLGDSIWTKLISYPNRKAEAINLIKYENKLLIAAVVHDLGVTISWPALIEIDTTGIISNSQEFVDTANLIPNTIYRCSDSKINLACTRALTTGGAITEIYKLDSSLNKLDSSTVQSLRTPTSINDSVFLGSQDGITIYSYNFYGDTLWTFFINEEDGALFFFNPINNSKILACGRISDGSYSFGLILKLDYSLSTSVNESINFNEENKVFIYPNPSGRTVTIRIPDKFSKMDFFLFTLYDNSNRPIFSKHNILSGETILDFENLPSSIYHYTLINKNAFLTGKLIIN